MRPLFLPDKLESLSLDFPTLAFAMSSVEWGLTKKDLCLAARDLSNVEPMYKEYNTASYILVIYLREIQVSKV